MARVRDEILAVIRRSRPMNLDSHLLDMIVCPNCRSSLAVDEAAEELVCSGCGYAYPVTRRHPGAARRRGPQAFLTP